VLDSLWIATKPLIGITKAVLEGDRIVIDVAILKATNRKVGKLLDRHRRLGVAISSDVGGRMLAGRTTERHSRSLQEAEV
jgi:hypothetical protein